MHWVPAGHFYSPIPSWSDRERAVARLGQAAFANLVGVDLRAEAQLALLEKLGSRREELLRPGAPNGTQRYSPANSAFCYTDAAIYGTLLLELRPRRVIEVGSGWSSALLLDVNDAHLGASVDITFVEPFPEVLRTVASSHDLDSRLMETPVQTLPLEIFDSLESADILFIDSTHVSKAASDVNYLLFEVIPRLKPGVWVHLHDIFFPFEYPPQWHYEGRAWNENYVVRAFLTHNSEFEISLFVNYLNQVHGDWITRCFPECSGIHGGSLWLRRNEP